MKVKTEKGKANVEIKEKSESYLMMFFPTIACVLNQPCKYEYDSETDRPSSVLFVFSTFQLVGIIWQRNRNVQVVCSCC